MFGAELRKDSIERVYALPDFIFRPQMHQKRLAAGLRPDPLGELKRSPRPLAAVGVAAKLLVHKISGGTTPKHPHPQ